MLKIRESSTLIRFAEPAPVVYPMLHFHLTQISPGCLFFRNLTGQVFNEHRGAGPIRFAERSYKICQTYGAGRVNSIPVSLRF